MCYHLTSTLPKNTNTESFRQVFSKYEMLFMPLNNSYVKSQLKKGEQYFITTKDHCDCDTILGRLSTTKRHDKIMDSKKVKNLRKKGWSEEEIENWIEEKIKKKKVKVGRKIWPELQEKEAKRWIEFISELLETGNISFVGFLKHWYHGNLESEQINIKEIKRIKKDNINVDLLTHIDEDILYEFYTN